MDAVGQSRGTVLAAAVIVTLAAAAYSSGLSGAFVADDQPSIAENPTIRSLWPPTLPLAPPQGGLAVSGRPLVNLTFAANYALGGTRTEGYHCLSLSLHLLSAVVLFGIVRRTLSIQAGPKAGASATGPARTGVSEPWIQALAVACLWALHPLQTGAVTYLSQRSEVLMGLLYLLTVYSFVRGALPAGRRDSRAWLLLSWAACLLGMASKEVMASAPIVVLLYDRTFVAGTFAAALRRRRGYYAGLAATWALLGALVLAGSGRGGTAGFGTAVGPWAYAVTQAVAIPHYLRLALWPHPLVFDYGRRLGGSLFEVSAGAAVTFALVAATAALLRRRNALGFLGVWFFAILAPSSSFVPVATETIAEHRMYLPLAAVCAIGVAGSWQVAACLRRRGILRSPAAACVMAWSAASVALGASTFRRNLDYADNLALYSDTIEKMPDNPVAENNLGIALGEKGRVFEAIAHYERAVALWPGYPGAQNNMGAALIEAGRAAEAIPHLQAALAADPGFGEAANNLGNALVCAGRISQAIEQYEEAVRIKPGYAEAHNNLAFALNAAARAPEAIAEAREALRLRPAYPEAHNNLGNALALAGRREEAIAQYGQALRLKPDLVEAQKNRAALMQGGDPENALGGPGHGSL